MSEQLNFNDGRVHVLADRNDPKFVVVVFRGKVILRLPAGLAKDMGKLLLAEGARAEAYENPHKIILQDALLARTGAPFALTDGSLREEALKSAQWDSEARKGMPMKTPVRQMGAQSAARAGMPSLRKWRTN